MKDLLNDSPNLRFTDNASSFTGIVVADAEGFESFTREGQNNRSMRFELTQKVRDFSTKKEHSEGSNHKEEYDKTKMLCTDFFSSLILVI